MAFRLVVNGFMAPCTGVIALSRLRGCRKLKSEMHILKMVVTNFYALPFFNLYDR